MESKHTDRRIASIAKGGHHAGSLLLDGSQRITEAERQEFARRWNAHPDLLEALQGLLAYVTAGDDHKEHNPTPAVTEARAAIAKAS